jgi:hypothetical protein
MNEVERMWAPVASLAPGENPLRARPLRSAISEF